MTESLASYRDALLSLLLARSFRYSEEGFTLTSGRHSHYYVDCKQTTLHPHGAYLCGRLLFDKVKGRGLGAVGGLTLGADPVVTAIAVVSHLQGEPLDAAIIRKQAKGHGTGAWIEGPATTDRPIAVVDDVCTTGKSTVEAIKRLRDAGYTVTHAVAIVDRNEGGREAVAAEGLQLDAVFTIDDILALYRQKP